MGLRALNNPESSFEDPYASTGTEAWAQYIPPLPYFGDRGIFFGGYTIHPSGDKKDHISYINITSTGNAADFGNLSEEIYATCACAGGGRGLNMGGDNISSAVNTINYITIATTGTSSDFGDLTQSGDWCGATSNG